MPTEGLVFVTVVILAFVILMAALAYAQRITVGKRKDE